MKLSFFLNISLISLLLNAQQFDIKKDFDLVNGFSDTIYLVKDEIYEDVYIIFNDKESLHAHLDKQNFEQTGEVISQYYVSVQKIQDFYITKNEVSETDYQFFRNSIGKAANESITLNDMQEYCDYVSELWGIPVRLPGLEHRSYQDKFHLIIDKSDWERKKTINKLNDYMQSVYGSQVPIHFMFDGIKYHHQIIKWEEVQGMLIDRNKLQVSVNTKNENINFTYPENQYDDIASVHVHFLALLDQIE